MTSGLSGSSLLADASGFAKTIYGLVADEFSPVDLADFGNILEHAILADVVLVPSATKTPDSMLSPIKMLIREGAVRLLEGRPPVLPMKPSPKSSANLPGATLKERLFNRRRNTKNDARFEAGRIAGAELAYGRPGMISLRQRDTYDRIARPAAEHWACNIMGNHHRLADALHAFRRRAAAPGYVAVRVPPFAQMILTRASTLDEALSMTLDYRHQCRYLRHSVDELYAMTTDAHFSPLQKAEAQAKFMETWEAIIKACGAASTARMTFASSGSQFLKHAGHASMAAFNNRPQDFLQSSQSALTALLDILDEDAWNEATAWTLRPIRTAARDYLTTPDQKLRDGAHRIFGVPRDICEAQMRNLALVLAEFEIGAESASA